MDTPAGPGYAASWTTEGTSGETTVTETEWLSANFALLLMGEAETIRSDAADPARDDWRAVAARVACLQRLGSDMPQGIRRWVSEATAYLDQEDRRAPADGLLHPDNEDVYRAFREAYADAGPELRQKLAASQDVFRGADYYCFEGYMLEEDETSLTYTGPVYAAESTAHCDLIRDIFGNPFRPSPPLPPAVLAWNDSAVVHIAQAAYKERHLPSGVLDDGRLAVLADALEEAGCTDADILSHLRGPGPHVRGCWPVDLCLGKT
ncbi:MAG TPA: hypothetical protein VH643_39925 [Gemmataceae bacterium]|jgi:hypothetical protein